MFNPDSRNDYASMVSGSAHDQLATLLSSPGTKLTTIAVLLFPAAFVALRSPVLLLAASTLLWRFIADNPHYWGTGFHYNAVLMPVVFAAFTDALAGRAHRLWARWAAATWLRAGTDSCAQWSRLGRIVGSGTGDPIGCGRSDLIKLSTQCLPGKVSSGVADAVCWVGVSEVARL